MASTFTPRRLRQLKDVLFSGAGTPGDVLTLQGDGETWAPGTPTGGPGGGALTDAGYLVTAADATLTNETTDSTSVAVAFDFLRIWNSAKTFIGSQ
jgi:hypothetical protein